MPDSFSPPGLRPELLQKWISLQAGEPPDTPVYLYDLDILRARLALLRSVLQGRFRISYAIKANPNQVLVGHISKLADGLDASSYSEVLRAVKTGINPGCITYSGPGKRLRELQAFTGTGADLVVESFEEIEDVAQIARGKSVRKNILIRINPDHVPRGFGASMSGRPSQFGIDETAVWRAIERVDTAPELTLRGFHIYTGSNCLSPDALIENFENMTRLFRNFSNNGARPLGKLIFGAGFGLPYHQGQDDLDLAAVQRGILPLIDGLRAHTGLQSTDFILELGRWLVGPAGALLTRVLSTKHSRGQKIAVCDAGFNNNLAACGMKGAVFRKDWPIRNLTGEHREIGVIKLTGPLCTSIDVLAGPLQLPEVRRDDILAVMLSGAYGLTASPTRFISHPEPVEIIHANGVFSDVTESRHNHFRNQGTA